MATLIEPGVEIDGFIVGEPVHGGAMGTLHRAHERGRERPLVIKAPFSGGGESTESVIAFETEASILLELRGPHVPVCVAVGDLARTPYLVLEWVEGQTLERRLAAGRPSADEIARIGAAVADAIHEVHQQEVVHLDLKPENVMLRPDGSVVLIDFGLAHHARLPDLHAEETRFRAGSAPYVSPEQLLGTRSDRRSDLFALGVVLYEAATGQLPFGEADTDVRNRFWLEPTPPVSLNASVEPWLQEIILRCLEPRAEARYQSAAHIAFDLRHPDQVVLTSRATKSRRSGPVAHIQRFLHARAEHGPQLRTPPKLLSATPIVLVAIDTEHLDDPRHPALHAEVAGLLSAAREFRLLCLTVIAPGSSALEHIVRLRHWAEPLGLPARRLSLHAIDSGAPAETIVGLARHNNADLIVVGAPADGERAFSQSVASEVTAKAPCSVHVVRVRKP